MNAYDLIDWACSVAITGLVLAAAVLVIAQFIGPFNGDDE